MKTKRLMVLLALASGPPALSQSAVNPTLDDQVFRAKFIAYNTCLQREFRKLTTPNFDDPDVYQLMKVGDGEVFATIKPACADAQAKLLVDLAGVASPEKALSDFDILAAQGFTRDAARARPGLITIAAAIRVPGPRPAIPLVEAIFADDYPAAAMRQNEQGKVTATFTVGIDGRVSGCTGAGATEALHAGACSVIVRRWRYAPALDASGQRVPELRTKAVSFYMH